MARQNRSLTIIDNIKPKSAAFVYTPPPTFKTKLEEQRYWAQEKVRWLEGHAGLTGYHYFYLTQCKIKIGNSGQVDRPVWRDCDQWILEDFAKARELHYDHGLISRREIGKTSIGGGLLPNYFMRVHPGSTSLLTSCDKPRIFRMFTDKTLAVYENMDKSLRGKILNKNQTKNEVYLKVQMPFRNKYGEAESAASDIFCSETVENPSAFSSVRAIYGYYDEFPLHKRGNELLTSSDPCYRDGIDKTGTVMWAGTVEDKVDMESLKRLRKIVGDSKESNTVLTFAPFWWGLSQFSVNGHSDKKKAEIWREKELERLSKLEDKMQLRAFQKNYPATLEEALDTAVEGNLPPECMAIIGEQRKRIMTEKPPVMTHRLEQNEDGTIEAIPDKTGKFYILTQPTDGRTYSAGIDPIPHADNDMGKGSEHAIIITENETMTPVAYYAERNPHSHIVNKNSILLQKYYKDAPAMLEKNVGGTLIADYKNNGYGDLLAKRPTSLGINFTQKSGVGFHKNNWLGARENEYLVKYIMENGENIWFQRLIDELEDFLIGNTDLLDAFQANLVYIENKVQKTLKATKKPVMREIRVIKRDAMGRTYEAWEWRNMAPANPEER